MISIFGIVSVVVALVSIAIIVLHNRVMIKRAPVDSYIVALEDLIRGRLESLYESSPHGSELQALCIQYMDLDLNSMVKALPEIDRAYEGDMYIDEHAINQAINETAQDLNQAIQEYNRFITGSLPVSLMAQVLALTTEDAIDLIRNQN